jgi:tRNA pseudouridine(55) synthase
MFTLNKPVGKTPLEVLEEFRANNVEYKDSILSYAGRLDPMASGELLILVDDENKSRRIYEKHNKEYEVDILFGVSTDTQDLMGLLQQDTIDLTNFNLDAAVNIIPSFVGSQEQMLPLYSSYRVNGKPLFWHARGGTVLQSSCPSKLINIISLTIKDIYSIDKVAISKAISVIANVKGDFRQDAVIERWNKLIESMSSECMLPVIKLKIVCSGGTYMRMLAYNIGQKLSTPSLALHIHRTKIYY